MVRRALREGWGGGKGEGERGRERGRGRGEVEFVIGLLLRRSPYTTISSPIVECERYSLEHEKETEL